MTTPEVRALEQDEAIGVEVERFLQGAAGRRMIHRFEEDRVAALEALADVDPEDPKAEWSDGVVKYSSAHIDGVESELIVRSGHSTQETSPTIEEVRRILFENLKTP